ncbi:hypothetical protein ACFQJD_09455 [Haloplanus sp. GCM10025708]|uniref:hypothetical protein n=1 Tax=Haloplanus sp. GCM10025708 TaxID=3252679 RepID=UPI00361A8D2A
MPNPPHSAIGSESRSRYPDGRHKTLGSRRIGLSTYGRPNRLHRRSRVSRRRCRAAGEPLYVTQSADGGSVIVSVDRTSAADGAAGLSSEIDRIDDLPPVAGYAARRAAANGSFAVSRDAPPLVLQLLRDEWRYLGSAERVAVYRPTVTVGDEETTLELENRSLESVESDLEITPPGRLDERDHAKEVSWLDQQSDDVVEVGDFSEAREHRLRRAVENGSVTVPNRNDADAFTPLGGDVRFVVHDDRFYRATVENGTDVTLRLTPSETTSSSRRRTSASSRRATSRRRRGAS